MCGIGGFYSNSIKNGSHFLDELCQALAHRGPDASGNFIKNTCGLTHRRLSILDLNEGANQPMHSQDGRFHMAFNGEIYNYHELKEEFAIETNGTGDSEVLLGLFAKMGPKCLDLLNGMFACAIYDSRDDTLWLFRDRLGIKPLYYFQDKDRFLFASELKALSLSQELKGSLSLDKTAIANYLHLGYLPKDQSIFNELKKFPPGCFAKVKTNSFELENFWKVEDKILDAKAMEDPKAASLAFENQLDLAVKRRMISDVPLGTFLSGGIDSSLVTALAQKNSSTPVKTFTIGFKESPKSEHPFAEKVAKHLGTNHHEYLLSYQEALDRFDSILDVYDEPFGDPSSIPTLLVSEIARKNVTVCLSGDGGDELFLGYGMHRWAQRLSNPLIRLSSPILKQLFSFSKKEKYQKAKELFSYPSKQDRASHIFSQEQNCFSKAELAKNFRLKQADFIGELPKLNRELSSEENQALFDLLHYLPNDLLVKVDRASMRYGLEVRVPLLDHTVVESALNLPKEFKSQNGQSKILLKQILFKHVPKKLFNRPKQGFSFPIREWLKTDLKYLIDTHLAPMTINKYGLVNPDYIEGLKRDFFGGKSFNAKRLWLLILLHKWLDKYSTNLKKD